MIALDTVLRRLPAILLTGVLLALVALAALGARSWLASRDAAVQLAATVAAQKQLLDQAVAREQQRDAELAKSLSDIAHAKNNVATPAQAVAAFPSALPPLPRPVSIDLPKPQPDDPTPPAVATVPQDDLKPLYDYLQDCRACQAQLAAAQGDLTDERSQVAALTKERDAAVRLARGGGFWSRLRHGAKWFVIGGAVGALAVSAARH